MDNNKETLESDLALSEASRDNIAARGRSSSSPGKTAAGGSNLRSSTSPSWLARCKETLGETPTFLIRTGSLKSKRIVERQKIPHCATEKKEEDRSVNNPSYVLQTGCYMWTGRAYDAESYIVQRREKRKSTRNSSRYSAVYFFSDATEKSQTSDLPLDGESESANTELAKTDGVLNDPSADSINVDTAVSRLDMMDLEFGNRKFDNYARNFHKHGGNIDGIFQNHETSPPPNIYETISGSYCDPCSDSSVDSGLGEPSENHPVTSKILSDYSSTNIYENVDSGEGETKHFGDISGTETDNKSADELIIMVKKKLDALFEQQSKLAKKVFENDVFAEEIARELFGVAGDRQTDKFNLHVREVDSATYLLLGLTARLAKVEKSIENVDITRWSMSSTEGELQQDCQEVDSLRRKRTKLLDQLEEARWIRNNIENRSKKIEKCLERYIGEEYVNIYRLFIQERGNLASETKEISDKIKLAIEQLNELQSRPGDWRR